MDAYDKRCSSFPLFWFCFCLLLIFFFYFCLSFCCRRFAEKISHFFSIWLNFRLEFFRLTFFFFFCVVSNARQSMMHLLVCVNSRLFDFIGKYPNIIPVSGYVGHSFSETSNWIHCFIMFNLFNIMIAHMIRIVPLSRNDHFQSNE